MAVWKRESRCITPLCCAAVPHCSPSCRVSDKTMTAVCYLSSSWLGIRMCHCGLTIGSSCPTGSVRGNWKATSMKAFMSESSKFGITFLDKNDFSNFILISSFLFLLAQAKQPPPPQSIIQRSRDKTEIVLT